METSKRRDCDSEPFLKLTLGHIDGMETSKRRDCDISCSTEVGINFSMEWRPQKEGIATAISSGV